MKRMSRPIVSLMVTVLLLFIFSSAQARSGAFLQADGLVSMLGNQNEGFVSTPQLDLDPGPGFNIRLGYRGDIVGVRGTFSFARMGFDGIQTYRSGFFGIPSISSTSGRETATTYAGLVDLLVYPLGKTAFFLQPFVAGGIGFGKVESGSNVIADVEESLVPHLGVGLSLDIIPHVSFVFEGDWRPHLYMQDVGGIDPDLRKDTLQIFTVSAGVQLVF